MIGRPSLNNCEILSKLPGPPLVDILGILAREVAKTEIDQITTKQAINALRALDPEQTDGAIRTLLDPDNLGVLAPVFVTLMRVLKAIYPSLSEITKDFLDLSLVNIYDRQEPVLRVEINLSYFVQVLGLRRSIRKEEILIELFDRSTSPIIRRMVIVIMSSWACHYWLSDLKTKYLSFSSWERRALILSSYVLGDEGAHWRDHAKASWNPFEILVRDWFSARWQKTKSFP